MNYENVIKAKALYGPYGRGGVVKGFVKSSEWNEVVAAFEDNFALNLELGSQLSIYCKGDNVVELFGVSSHQVNYDQNTLQNIFSSGKNLEAICIALLVDRGLLNYDDKVCKHWPEFGKYGKENITVADVLRHESGLPFFSDPEHISDPMKDRRLTNQQILDVVPMEEIIASSGVYRDADPDPYADPSDSADARNSLRHYHSTTRGWILSGLIRRVDTKGRTLGQFMHDEVCQNPQFHSYVGESDGTSKVSKLGLDIFCGMSPELQSKYNFARLSMISPKYLAMHEILPGQLANALSKYERDGPFGSAVAGWLRNIVLKPTTPATQGMINTFWTKMKIVRRHNSAKFLNKLPNYMNSVEGRTLECPSVTMQANAASLGKLAGLMAAGGRLIGNSAETPLLSSEAIAEALSEPKYSYDHYMKSHLSYTKGGFCDFRTFDASMSKIVHPQFHQHMHGFYGWGGLGGSLFIFHPEKQVGLAYTMNGMALCSIGGPRTDRIMKACQRVMQHIK